ALRSRPRPQPALGAGRRPQPGARLLCNRPDKRGSRASGAVPRPLRMAARPPRLGDSGDDGRLLHQGAARARPGRYRNLRNREVVAHEVAPPALAATRPARRPAPDLPLLVRLRLVALWAAVDGSVA